MRPGLTTAFASVRQASDDALSPPQIIDACLRAQAGAVVLDAALRPALYEPLVRELQRRGNELPLLTLETPCPTPARPGGRDAELASPDRDEAHAALEAALATVRQAGGLRAPFVVVRLGEVRAAATD